MFNTVAELVEAINSRTSFRAQENDVWKGGKKRHVIEITGYEDNGIRPVLYEPENYLEKDLDEMVEFLNRICMEHGLDANEIKYKMTDREWILHNVKSKLVNALNYEDEINNRGFAYSEFADFKELYYVEVAEGGRVTLKEDQLRELNIELDEVKCYAHRNGLLDLKVQTMEEILTEMLGCKVPEMEGPADDKMYVVSNKNKLFGACYLTDKIALDVICEYIDENDIIILPSSIHEFIVIPYDVANDKTELINMVGTINDTEVRPEEILSYRVFHYIKDQGKLYPVI